MAEDGQLARIAGGPASAEPSLADLLDPIALEERLREARARRAEALARRPTADAPPRRPPPPPAPRHDPPPAFLAQPAARPPAGRAGLAHPFLVFLAGIGLGGAAVAVLALQALPARIAAVPAPPAPVVAAPEAPPPDVAVSPAVPAAASAAPGRDAAPPTYAALDPPDPARLPEPASEAAPPHAGPLPPLSAAAPPPPSRPEPQPTHAAPPAARLPAQVFIHYPPSASAAAAEARDALVAAGIGRVEIVPVHYAIGRSNIRFYHDGDQEPAAALALLVSPVLDGDQPEARDFTDYATPTAPGKVEIWLAGSPDGSARPRAPAILRAAPSTPEPFRMPDVIAPAPTQAEQVERILIERLTQQSR